MSSIYDEYQRQMYEMQRMQIMQQAPNRLIGQGFGDLQNALSARPNGEIDRNSQLLLLEDVK